MTVVLGAIGWGLLAIGATTDVWHHQRLRELLAMHVDSERPAAAALVAIELALAIAIPVALLSDASWRSAAAMAGTLVGIGFAAWITRLLATDSVLPCACSFSSGPTSRWSLVRAAAIALVVALVWSQPADLTAVEIVMGLATGLAVAAALYVLPEALTWPAPSRAQLARIESHRPDRQSGRTNRRPSGAST